MKIIGPVPEHILKLVPAHIRATMPGASGMTRNECEAAAVAKSEKELQNQIVAMLRRNGIWVVQQRMDRRSNVALGTPDLLFAVTVPVAFECKMPGKNPTEEQVAAMATMTANGWRCYVVRSYAEALTIFKSITTETP